MFFLLTQLVFAESKDFTFSDNAGNLYIKVYKADTMGSALAHNHAIGATGWKGTASVDKTDLATCKFSFSVPVNGLEADSAKFRKLAGIADQGQPSDSERTDIKANMLAEGQLNAKKFGTISFESTSCSKDNIKGKFTLRGKTNDISIPVKMEVGEKLSLKGQFDIKSTDYGFAAYSIMFGQIANQETMTIVFDMTSN
jgi:polyisoprenoid-binding protein YceI